MAPGHPRFSTHEIVERGKAIYEQQIRAKVGTEENKGKFLIVDIETGDYEIDDDEIAATRRAHARHPDGAFYGMRVGCRAAEVLGGPRWHLGRNQGTGAQEGLITPNYFRVRMPRMRGDYIPMGAIYYMPPPFTSQDCVRPILAFWEGDFRERIGIVWSEDASQGGPPYWCGKADEEGVQKLLDKLEALGAFTSPARNRSMEMLDSSKFVIAFAAGSRRVFMQSHDRVPIPRHLAVNELDLEFCQLWGEVDDALMSLRPDRGKHLGRVEFELEWLP